jgi:uncharacterized membrane-anchored protein YhcB (DUF1043 family)
MLVITVCLIAFCIFAIWDVNKQHKTYLLKSAQLQVERDKEKLKEFFGENADLSKSLTHAKRRVAAEFGVKESDL